MLEKLIKIANEQYDGHFTILKFTNNYRVCFGTIVDIINDTDFMAEGKTLDEAIKKAIDKNINSYDINKKAEENAKYDLLNIAFGDQNVDIDEAIRYYEKLSEEEKTDNNDNNYDHEIKELEKLKKLKKTGAIITWGTLNN